jgi:hypothetical protein
MIKKIFSKLQSDKLLHVIHSFDAGISREDIAPSDQFLQVASMQPPGGKKFNPHFHIWKQPGFDSYIAQESWIVISGSIKVTYYDLDNTIMDEEIILPGGCTITFDGGHAYEILEENTKIYEFKVGPYLGRENDKIFI